MDRETKEHLLIRVEEFISKVTEIGTYDREPDVHADYVATRKELMEEPFVAAALPTFIKASRTASDLRAHCQSQGGYGPRRAYINEQFEPLRKKLEGATTAPADDEIRTLLKAFNEASVHAIWEKALERRANDPDAAITAARTLLETVCKHILDRRQERYSDGAELPALYGQVARLLNIAPSGETDDILKSICGNCMNVVGNIGALRNRASDAHGRGEKAVGPEMRHATLAVNIAGTLATFLVETFNMQFGTEGAAPANTF